MKRKDKERKEARELRKQGKSVRVIAKEVGVSKASVSVWVKDIELTEDQKLSLSGNRNPTKASMQHSRNAFKRRMEYQAEGREQAKKYDSLHLMGCMLYWAEGYKSVNDTDFTNSNPNMMQLFIKFLRSINIKDEDMTVYIHCYINNNLSVGDIENYWLNLLELPKSCLRKTMANKTPKSSTGKKANKLLYGVCKIRVHKVEVVQHIYGAIQEYIGVDVPEWIGGNSYVAHSSSG